LAPLLAALACAPTGDGDDEGETGELGEPAVTEALGDGVYRTILDATADATWRYYDFESRAHVLPADAADDPIWDLGALRFNLKTNGGTSGKGGGAVAILEGTSFDAVTEAPGDGYAQDTALGPGMGGDAMADVSPGYAFDNW